MNVDKKEIEKIINNINNISYIEESHFPNIELYMDQVTSFIDKELCNNKRFEDDKILTKTMINNYAKNKLFSSPIKKKYTKNHLILFCLIYYLKNFLQISDIKELIVNLEYETDLPNLYKKIVSNIGELMPKTYEDILEKFNESFDLDENSNIDALYVFIAQLSYDIYIRKQLIEKIIDLTKK